MSGRPPSLPDLGVSRLHFPITALGYGQRIGLWTQGCSIGCKGCMSVDTWPPAKKRTSIHSLVDRLEPWLDGADGLTVSGGEPFDQGAALTAFLQVVRPRLAGDVLVFTGYDFDHIPDDARTSLAFIDAIVCGPFMKARASALPLRGSDNQGLHILTSLGAARYSARELDAAHPRRIDIIHDDSGLWFAGIPKPGDLERLSTLLRTRSMSFKTSAGRLGGTR